MAARTLRPAMPITTHQPTSTHEQREAARTNATAGGPGLDLVAPDVTPEEVGHDADTMKNANRSGSGPRPGGGLLGSAPRSGSRRPPDREVAHEGADADACGHESANAQGGPRGSRRRTTEGAPAARSARRATARARRAARTSRRRSAGDPSPGGGRTGAPSATCPTRSVCARASNCATAEPAETAARTPRPTRGRRRRSAGMRLHGDLASPTNATGGIDVIEEGTPAPDFALKSDAGETIRLSRASVASRLSSTSIPRRHNRLHDAGVRDPRRVRGVRAGGRRRARRVARRRGVARQVPEQVRPAVHPARSTDHKVAELYGVWAGEEVRRPHLLGCISLECDRRRDGNVKRVMHNVKPDTHTHDVLALSRARRERQSSRRARRRNRVAQLVAQRRSKLAGSARAPRRCRRRRRARL